MDAISAYSFGTLGWHALQAVPLIVFPQVIGGLLSMDAESGAVPAQGPDGTEAYFARALGLALLALGLVTVVLTGALGSAAADAPPPPPAASGPDAVAGSPSSPRDDATPYASLVVLLTTLHHAAVAWQTWARYGRTGEAGFALGFAGSVALAVLGAWCTMFAGAPARRSRRTGADKRTSGWPFRNDAAALRKKGSRKGSVGGGGGKRE
ncbi:hypothetical protein GGR56DRAFT_681336 [Xylariaceae sp. FL0804]|nr:hypothetical protein GGR56DRAFT_681336 [Xylariaceae sp. FL0804]